MIAQFLAKLLTIQIFGGYLLLLTMYFSQKSGYHIYGEI